MACNDNQWLTERIEKAEDLIAQYEEALLQLGTQGIASYTIDTGQSRQTVTRSNLTELRHALDSLENRRATLIARRDGCGVHQGRPGW